ncbi:hypothetical protein HPB47_005665 [Ixodes persulcatus]|uniref:Uncharacterized protein n=1 Tax=Ixodes persulcatus TaxID=34615 RepID=A0AC60PCF2_IXOPE|nr:hypothetical protein HPB47_005665 [Ixodes persulcatus]
MLRGGAGPHRRTHPEGGDFLVNVWSFGAHVILLPARALSSAKALFVAVAMLGSTSRWTAGDATRRQSQSTTLCVSFRRGAATRGRQLALPAGRGTSICQHQRRREEDDQSRTPVQGIGAFPDDDNHELGSSVHTATKVNNSRHKGKLQIKYAPPHNIQEQVGLATHRLNDGLTWNAAKLTQTTLRPSTTKASWLREDLSPWCVLLLLQRVFLLCLHQLFRIQRFSVRLAWTARFQIHGTRLHPRVRFTRVLHWLRVMFQLLRVLLRLKVLWEFPKAFFLLLRVLLDLWDLCLSVKVLWRPRRSSRLRRRRMPAGHPAIPSLRQSVLGPRPPPRLTVLRGQRQSRQLITTQPTSSPKTEPPKTQGADASTPLHEGRPHRYWRLPERFKDYLLLWESKKRNIGPLDCSEDALPPRRHAVRDDYVYDTARLVKVFDMGGFGQWMPIRDTRLREAGAEVLYCLTRRAPKGPSLPRARLNHHDVISPDTEKPRTARRGQANPHGPGSVETPLSKHLLSQVPPAGIRQVTPVFGKRGPKWCIASPGGPRRVQAYPGLDSTIMMPFSPDRGKPRTARRGQANPHGPGSVETPLSKHLLSQVPPAGIRQLQVPIFAIEVQSPTYRDVINYLDRITSFGVLQEAS